MSNVRKVRRLLKHPQALLGVVKTRLIALEKSRLDLSVERARSFDFLRAEFGVDASSLLQQYESGEFLARYVEAKEGLKQKGLLSEEALTSDFDCVTMYLLVRAARPGVVVETGAFQGGFTAHILQALHENGEGLLHSVDLPKVGLFAGQEGALVPESLRERWTLHLGDSKQVLPRLLEQLRFIDLFHHDSLHSFRHMLWEFQTAHPYLSADGLLTSHDVIVPRYWPGPFSYFCKKKAMRYEIFRNLGVARHSR